MSFKLQNCMAKRVAGPRTWPSDRVASGTMGPGSAALGGHGNYSQHRATNTYLTSAPDGWLGLTFYRSLSVSQHRLGPQDGKTRTMIWEPCPSVCYTIIPLGALLSRAKANRIASRGSIFYTPRFWIFVQ
jgi:hypothetical protein